MKYRSPRLLAKIFLILFAMCAALQTMPVHAADFSFPALKAHNEWPTEGFWTQLDLPSVLGAATVSHVKVSSKNSIFPLKAKNGIMFSGRTDDKTFAQICDALWESGCRGTVAEDGKIADAQERSAVQTDNVDRVFYRAYYTLKGELMHIEASRSSRGKLSITIRYLPDL